MVLEDGRRELWMGDASGDRDERMKWFLEMFETDREVGSARFCHCSKGEASSRSVTSLVISDY